jgi:2-iminobutanoate/2-iminopropanoate deaminase
MSGEDLSAFGAGTEFSAKSDVFALTGLTGVDPKTGELADGAEAQFAQAFANVEELAGRCGFSREEIGRITVFTPDASYRPLINPGWLSLFPEDGNRPARKTTHVPLDPNVFVELEVVGARGARESIEIDGVRHKDPLPMGARVGRHVFSSVIVTDVPHSDERLDGVPAIQQNFDNMTAFIEAAGGTLDDISNVWVFLGMWELHERYVDIWCDVFKDEHSRPSRKTNQYPQTSVQMQLEAVIGGGRKNLEIPGIGHHDPIPMGAITGGVFTSSGVDARDPATGEAPADVPARIDGCLANLDRLLEQAQLSREHLYQVTGLVEDRSSIPAFTEAWRRYRPDTANPPAFQTLALGMLNRPNGVQILARGIA